ncbi:MAG: TlpA family protein disulfide reductase, partial [Planctomycetaceae bacterium]|nr:TlpA family protein disulfide reductase [Planctomycetaceae bacterium]
MLRFNFCWLLLSALLIVSASCGKNQNNALQNESPENSCCSAETEESQNSSRRAVGAPFELKGKTTDGDDFSWDAYKDKFVLIDFTASWCGPCRAEMPNLLDIYAKYHDKGFEIISIGISDKTENLKKQIEEDKITWTMISEELS